MNADEQNAAPEEGADLEVAAALAGGVAHDLANLLTVIVGNAEMLSEELADQPGLVAFADMILAATQRGTALTERLDRFHQPVLEGAVPLNVAALLTGLGQRIAASLPPGIRLDLQVAEDLRRVRLRREALGAAVEALIGNALAAMSGEGRLSIKAQNAPGMEPRIRISVEDSGCGMPPEIIERLRQTRFMSDTKGDRTGLGLALAQRVALAASGRLLVRSRQGQGTRVTLELAAQP